MKKGDTLFGYIRREGIPYPVQAEIIRTEESSERTGAMDVTFKVNYCDGIGIAGGVLMAGTGRVTVTWREEDSEEVGDHFYQVEDDAYAECARICKEKAAEISKIATSYEDVLLGLGGPTVTEQKTVFVVTYAVKSRNRSGTHINEAIDRCCSSIAEAEEVIKHDALYPLQDYHHFTIREMAVSGGSRSNLLCERLYNSQGEQVDRTLAPSGEWEPFNGRTSEQMRFHTGDIVQFVSDGKLVTGIVRSTPATVQEAAAAMNAGDFLTGSDDIYRILTPADRVRQAAGNKGEAHFVNSVKTYAPVGIVPEKTVERLKDILQESITAAARNAIRDTTSVALLEDVLDGLGVSATVSVEVSGFELMIDTSGDGPLIFVEEDKVITDTAMVRDTLERMLSGAKHKNGYQERAARSESETYGRKCWLI